MARTKQTARRDLGGKAPRKSHASKKATRHVESEEKSKSEEERIPIPLPKKSKSVEEKSKSEEKLKSVEKPSKKDFGELFRTKPSYHPKTNEIIKIGGTEYKKLEKKYGEPNKIKSPKTQTKIGVNKGEYKKLIKEGYTNDQLLYGIIDNKNKNNDETIEKVLAPTFKNIALLNDYLIQLDYVDLRNLCRTDQSFKSICDDDSVIKGILAETISNVVFKMNVATLMKKLNNQIEKLINFHYSDLPVWVNVELFMISMKKKIYTNLAISINNHLDGYDIEKRVQLFKMHYLLEK